MSTSISNRYRLKRPTIGLFGEDERQVARMVPKGAIVTVNPDTFNGNDLVEVSWDEKKVMMFPRDIRVRSEKIG